MKTKMKGLLAVLCGVVMLCNGGRGMVVHAQENENTLISGEYRELTEGNIAYGIYDIPDCGGARAATLTNCSIALSVGPDGIQGSLHTGSTVTASKIGIENVRLEKYVNGKWVLVASDAGGYKTNSNTHGYYVAMNSAETGVYYRLSGTHYAYLNGVRHALNNGTDGVKYP